MIGFIGSHVVRLFLNKYPEYTIYNLDKLTYAGNLENLKDIEHLNNYYFLKEDICDFKRIKKFLKISYFTRYSLSCRVSC